MADLYWVLDDEQQQQLLRLSPEAFGGDRAAWGLALAQTNALRGAQALARAYADSATQSPNVSVQARGHHRKRGPGHAAG